MEFLIKIIFLIVNWSSLLFVPLIFVVVGLFMVKKPFAAAIRRARSESKDAPLFGRVAHKVVWLCILLAFGMLFFVFANLLRPHFLDAGMIHSMGHFADARIFTKELTSSINNNEPVMLFNIMYKTNAGEMIETAFYSTDGNFYPPTGSVSYPEPGETFRVAYLPSFPDVFVILTEAESTYIKNNRCGDLKIELRKAINRRDFEPDNEQYARQLADAAKRFADAGCN